MSYVYEITYRDRFYVTYVDFVNGDDMYTALSKWRTKIAAEKRQLDFIAEEPDTIARINEAEIIP